MNFIIVLKCAVFVFMRFFSILINVVSKTNVKNESDYKWYFQNFAVLYEFVLFNIPIVRILEKPRISSALYF